MKVTLTVTLTEADRAAIALDMGERNAQAVDAAVARRWLSGAIEAQLREARHVAAEVEDEMHDARGRGRGRPRRRLFR